MSLPVRQVYDLARGTGLSHTAAVTATAIAMAESGLNPAATGDVGLQDGTWGPSLGRWQIRSLRAETGTGGHRDATRLTDPAFNARSMFAISNGGTNWSPWSVFTSGAYAGKVPEVSGQVGTGSGVSTISAPAPAGAAQTVPAASVTPGAIGDVLGGAVDSLNPAEALLGAFAKTMALAVAVGLGVTLVAVGAWRAAT